MITLFCCQCGTGERLLLRHQILAMHQLVSDSNHSTIEFESGLFHIAHSLVRKAGKLNHDFHTPLSKKIAC